jgi:hypothetical protein
MLIGVFAKVNAARNFGDTNQIPENLNHVTEFLKPSAAQRARAALVDFS